MELTQTPTVGSFVANDFRAATVFQKYGIDFCCKGGKTITEVCKQKNIDSEQLLLELNEVVTLPSKDQADYQAWPLDFLADYIVKKHHSYVEHSISALKPFLEKLCNVHGSNHPELFEISKEFIASAGELAVHMKKEEMILFPFIRRMVAAKNNGSQLETPGFGNVENPINMMRHEHDVEGERFRRIAQLTGNYTVPADGCTTYRVAFSLLKDFEEDLHLHIHLENNILFPKALEMEQSFRV